MTAANTVAVNRRLDVHLDGGPTIRVATHGPHRKGEFLCIIVCAGDDRETIRVTVYADAALVEWGSEETADLCDRAATPIALDGESCVPCAVHAAVGDAVVALLPSDPTPQQVALHVALDNLTQHMPGHEHAEETP